MIFDYFFQIIALLRRILAQSQKNYALLLKNNATLARVEKRQLQQDDVLNELADIDEDSEKLLKRIAHVLIPGDPVGFRIEMTVLAPTTISPRRGVMTLAKDTAVDLQILDDGKGVLYTLTPVNAAGAAVPLPAGSQPIVPTSSDPALTLAQDPGDPTANPPRLADTTGLVFLGSIAQPAKDVVGVVATFTDTLENGTTISTAALAVDIVPDPNNPNNPTGFTIAESAV